MKIKIQSLFSVWATLYFLPVGLFILGTVLETGNAEKKLEIYFFLLCCALCLTTFSYYSTFFLLDKEKVLLSTFFIKKTFNLNSIDRLESAYFSVFGMPVETIRILLRDKKFTGISRFPFSENDFAKIKLLLHPK